MISIDYAQKYPWTLCGTKEEISLPTICRLEHATPLVGERKVCGVIWFGFHVLQLLSIILT